MDAREAIRQVEELVTACNEVVGYTTNLDEAVATLKGLVPKRYVVHEDHSKTPQILWCVKDHDYGDLPMAFLIPTREAAERIAAEYEEAGE